MKQILLVNDVVGYSKVGMVAMLPILSYLGIPTYSLPTALVSNTLYGKNLASRLTLSAQD